MIYFDNAATTPLDPQVTALMGRVLGENYGNPSSVHALGRVSRVIVEDARRTVAGLLNVSPSCIFFTSCGTEALNTVLLGAAEGLGVKNIISSRIEHHAVLHSLEVIEEREEVKVHYVDLLPDGHIDLGHLEVLLGKCPSALVCLMHANNEIGTLLDLDVVSALCKAHSAFFLADTVQSLGKYRFDLKKLPIDFAACSAHKFHGPKGSGFLYVREGLHIPPLLHGGGQERNMRSGTENIAGIAGLAEALKIAVSGLDEYSKHVLSIRDHMVQQLRDQIPGVLFNNDLSERGLYNMINVSFPAPPYNSMLLQLLDIAGVCASGGSACSSGAVTISPVLKSIGRSGDLPNVRFSFSKFNKMDEVMECMRILREMPGK